MEYHRDRFTDHSLVICDDGRLVAIFPASRHGDELISHGGLTFGGFIVGKHEYARNTLRYMAELFAHCHHNGIPRVVFKQNPSFYSVVTQDETDHAMFLMDAEMYRMDTAFAMDMMLKHGPNGWILKSHGPSGSLNTAQTVPEAKNDKKPEPKPK